MRTRAALAANAGRSSLHVPRVDLEGWTPKRETRQGSRDPLLDNIRVGVVVEADRPDVLRDEAPRFGPPADLVVEPHRQVELVDGAVGRRVAVPLLVVAGEAIGGASDDVH